MALAVDRYELGQIGTNCYVVRSERGAPELVVVDPGDDSTTLRLELAKTGGTVAAILVTHTHYDHIGAVADLAEATGAPVYVSDTEAQVLGNPDAFYPAMRIRPWQSEHTLAGDETIELAGIEFQTVAVPGHSPGHLAYYSEGSLFSGDVLFAGSVGRTDQCPAAGSRSRPSTAGESNRGAHNQSTEPLQLTSAAVRRSDRRA